MRLVLSAGTVAYLWLAIAIARWRLRRVKQRRMKLTRRTRRYRDPLV